MKRGRDVSEVRRGTIGVEYIAFKSEQFSYKHGGREGEEEWQAGVKMKGAHLEREHKRPREMCSEEGFITCHRKNNRRARAERADVVMMSACSAHAGCGSERAGP